MNKEVLIICSLVNYHIILMIHNIIQFHQKIIVTRVSSKNLKKMLLIEYFNILQMILLSINQFQIHKENLKY